MKFPVPLKPRKIRITDLTTDVQTASQKQLTIAYAPITGTAIGTLSNSKEHITDQNPKTCSSTIKGNTGVNHAINGVPKLLNKARKIRPVLTSEVKCEVSKKTAIGEDHEGTGCHAESQRNFVFAREHLALCIRNVLGWSPAKINKSFSNDKISEIITLTFKDTEYSQNEAKREGMIFINRFIDYTAKHYPKETKGMISYVGVVEPHLVDGFHIHFEIFNPFLAQETFHLKQVVSALWLEGISHIGEAHLSAYQVDILRGANYFAKNNEIVDKSTGEIIVTKKNKNCLILCPAVTELIKRCTNRYYLPINEFLCQNIVQLFTYETKQKEEQIMVTELKGGGYHSFKLYCSTIDDYTPNFDKPQNNFITGRTAVARSKIRKENAFAFKTYVQECKDALSTGIRKLTVLLATKSSKILKNSFKSPEYEDDDPLRDTPPVTPWYLADCSDDAAFLVTET